MRRVLRVRLAMCAREGEARSKARVVSEYPRIWESGETGGQVADGVTAARSYFYFMSS